jgi:hypothetical protein
MANHLKSIVALMAVCVLALAGGVPPARAAVDEAELKVGYIYNFMKFVEWPNEQSRRDFIVCVLGSNPFGPVIQSLAGKVIRNQGIRVVTEVPLEQTKYCQVVFVSRSEAGRLMPALLRLGQMPVLTISDIEGFSGKGGVIEFVDTGNAIAFRISQKSAAQAGLHVSSKLLSMSR